MVITRVKLTSITLVMLVVLMGVTLRLGFETNHFEMFWNAVQITSCFLLVVGAWYLFAPPHLARIGRKSRALSKPGLIRSLFLGAGCAVLIGVIPEPMREEIGIWAGIGFASLIVLALVLGLFIGAMRRLGFIVKAPTAHAEFAWQNSVEDRLDELERLKRRDMVTPEEYAAKRLEILKDL
jgi:MFS family permease